MHHVPSCYRNDGKEAFEGHGRNHAVDMLRGVSILLVIFNHLGLRIPLAKTALSSWIPGRVLHAINYRGYEGVFIFFVISGFLITTNGLRRSGSLARINFQAFYARRFARIVPLLFALVVALSLLHWTRIPGFVIHRPDQSLAGAIMATFGLHLNWYEGQTGWLPGSWDVLWSLSIEEAFYIGFPVLCILTRRLWVLVPWLALLAASLPVTRGWLHTLGNEIWLEKAYLPGMAAIATGILGALFAAHVRPRQWLASSLIVAGLLGLTTVLGMERYVWRVLGEGFMLVLTVSTASLLIGVQWRQSTDPQPAWRGFGWLRSLGFHSYEIYLTHMFVVLGMVALFEAAGSYMQFGFLWYLPATLLAWLLGVMIARHFSIPVERRLRSLLLPAPRQPNNIVGQEGFSKANGFRAE